MFLYFKLPPGYYPPVAHGKPRFVRLPGSQTGENLKSKKVKKKHKWRKNNLFDTALNKALLSHDLKKNEQSIDFAPESIFEPLKRVLERVGFLNNSEKGNFRLKITAEKNHPDVSTNSSQCFS